MTTQRPLNTKIAVQGWFQNYYHYCFKSSEKVDKKVYLVINLQKIQTTETLLTIVVILSKNTKC